METLQQYFGVKATVPDTLILIRVEDFYEAYGNDAIMMAKMLNITVTSREFNGQQIAMSGVPYHSVEKYLVILNALNGIRIAIIDQIEDPKKAKGTVKRAVTRTIEVNP